MRLARYSKQQIGPPLLEWSLNDIGDMDDALEGWLELENPPVKG